MHEDCRAGLERMIQDASVIGRKVLSAAPAGYALMLREVKPQVGVGEEHDPQGAEGGAECAPARSIRSGALFAHRAEVRALLLDSQGVLVTVPTLSPKLVPRLVPAGAGSHPLDEA